MSSYRNSLASKLSRIIGSRATPARLSYRVSKETHDPEVHIPIDTEGTNLSCTKRLAAALNDGDEPRINHFRIAHEGRKRRLILRLCRNEFVDGILNSLPVARRVHGSAPRTLIEFSSPNIAKPFHAGHLRSAIIGNFLANIYGQLGHDVIKLNYLGDWGTQFGYLQLGVDLKGLSDDDIKRNPIETLYEAYVHAYKLATDDETLHTKARAIFSDMEQGRCSDLSTWEKFRSYTVDELTNVYRRLGIAFDHFHWESQYGINDISHVVSLLQSNNLLFSQADGRKIVKVGNRNVPIVKSDGSTLYLTRDVAALIDRHERFKFDKAMYVVDNSQSDHFAALISIAQQLDLSYASDVSHVKFGRVHGMSTRRGSAVFLKDILDEAEHLMRHKQMNKSTTKVNVADDPEVTATLGTTAVIVNDLKQRRMRDYEFSWDKALQTDGDCGIKLQYTHCRLWSLERNAEEDVERGTCRSELLPELDALNLVCELANYDDVLSESAEKQEACILVNYLFGLCNATNRCIQSMNVKNEPSKDTRLQRLKLFSASRKVLHHGMTILGLKPLKEM